MAARAAARRGGVELAPLPRAPARAVPRPRDVRPVLEPGIPRWNHALERRGFRAAPILRAALRRGGRTARGGIRAGARLRRAGHVQWQVVRRAVPGRARTRARRGAAPAAPPPRPAAPRAAAMARGAAGLPVDHARVAR